VVSPESSRVIDSYIVSEILDILNINLGRNGLQMTFKASTVVPIEGSYMSCYKWSIVTFAASLTVSEIQAVSMPKTTFLPTPLVFNLEFEVHAVGVWRRNLTPEN